MKTLLLGLLLSANLFALNPKEDHAALKADTLAIGSERFLALTIKHEEKWHTYWKNPGDAGIVTQFKFTNGGQVVELLASEWPAPHRYIEAGDILTYGYEGDPTFFFKLGNLKGELAVDVKWLVCKDICLPGGQVAQLLLSGNDAVIKTPRSGLSDAELMARFKALPRVHPWPRELEIYLSKTGEKTLRLDYSAQGFPVAKLNRQQNLLTPFLAPPLGFKKEEIRVDAKEQSLAGKMTVEWDGEYQEPPRPLPNSGVFSPPLKLKFLYQTPTGETWVLEKEISSFSLTAVGVEEHFQTLAPLDGKVATDTTTKHPGLLFMLALAFLGGLILNLMPCVLPVISLKLFGMIKHQTLPHRRILLHNLSYSAGVIVTFLALAATVAIIKASGEFVGWGFQLQSPLFVLAMIMVLFVFALNLFGLFEFVTPGGRHLGNAQTDEGLVGDFFSGVLSTILSTPCSAPFLGTALTFAFTSSLPIILLTFTFVGLGLAFPFLLTGIFPALIHFFPRPGAWMEKLKYFLGGSLLLTVAWLSDVFLNLVDGQLWHWPLALLFISVFFGFFFRARISKNLGFNLIFFLLPLGILIGATKTLPLTPPAKLSSKPEATWTPWSPALMESLRGQWAFVDFTASWCLTCKVNKKLVLDTAEFQQMAQAKGIKLVRADWTQRDDIIAKFLEGQGVVGIPAYFLQRPDGSLIYLGETISISKVEKNLN